MRLYKDNAVVTFFHITVTMQWFLAIMWFTFTNVSVLWIVELHNLFRAMFPVQNVFKM